MFRGFIAILVVVSITATASHVEECPPASPEVTSPATGVSLSAMTVGGENPGIYYIDNEPCQVDGCLFSIWIYEETNGQEGLQRGNEFACECGCNGETPPDTIVF